jgi:acetoacetate decarboxylase
MISLETGGFLPGIYLKDQPAIAGGRELWGFSKKYASPRLIVDTDILFGTLDYGKVRICELVRYYISGVTLKCAWTGPSALELYPHALAPVADLPVLKVQSALHFVADLTLDLGEVVYDYLAA